jgi:hypothetical protein
MCLCIPPINFWIPEPIFMKLGMYIMAPEPISTAYYINPSHQSVCLYVYPSYHCKATARLSVSLHSVLGNGSVTTFQQQRTHATIDKFLNALFSIRSVSYQRRVCGSLWSPLSLLDNNSVKTFPRERRIVGGVVFYAARVVSKESRRLVLPRTSWYGTYFFRSLLIPSLLIWSNLMQL